MMMMMDKIYPAVLKIGSQFCRVISTVIDICKTSRFTSSCVCFLY